MHDARAAHAPNSRQTIAAMGDQRIDQGQIRIAGRGMDHQAGRLVDHDQFGILIQDFERDFLPLRLVGRSLRHLRGEGLAGFDPV